MAKKQKYQKAEEESEKIIPIVIKRKGSIEQYLESLTYEKQWESAYKRLCE